jgi:hypothetical protein
MFLRGRLCVWLAAGCVSLIVCLLARRWTPGGGGAKRVPGTGPAAVGLICEFFGRTSGPARRVIFYGFSFG